MGCSLKNRYTFLYLLHLFTLSIPFLLLLPTNSVPDTTTLIYKGCANQKLPDPSSSYSHTLNSLFSSLLSQASHKNFAAATSGDGASFTAVYQCRGDLSNSDCYNCVSKITDMVGKLCDADVAAVRVQLSGCYLRYEMVGFNKVPETQLLYKVCGSKKLNDDGVGFEEKRDTAFGMVENGVKSGSNMFYTGSYESLYVLGQCEGDLGNGECGDCVSSAQQQAKTLCGDSISAQVYLHGCYISYSFYPNGIPTTTSSPGSESEGGHQKHTNRTVALAVGGFAALGFFIAFMLFLKSALKKKGGKH